MNKNKTFANSPIKIAIIAVTVIAILTITAFTIAGNVLSNDVDEKVAIEKSVDIILSDLGINESHISDLSATYGNKGSSPIYKIQFSTEDYEFSYNVNAHTGEVLSFTKDQLEKEPPAEVDNNSNSNQSSATTSIIDLEDAKSIALSSANLDYNDVIFTKSKLDKDDALYLYEIEFDYNNLSYEYEIDAYSGKILDSEIDD